MSEKTDEEALLVISMIALFYGVIVGAGAFYGYTKKGSKASLAVGGAASICLIVTTIVTLVMPNQTEAWGCLAVFTLAVCILGLVRWQLYPDDRGYKKFMPMGFIAVLSAAVFFLICIALIIVET